MIQDGCHSTRAPFRGSHSTFRVLRRAKQARALLQRPAQNWACKSATTALAHSCWRAPSFQSQHSVLGAFPRLKKGHVTTALVALHSRMNSSSEGGSWVPPSTAGRLDSWEQAFGDELVAVSSLQLTNWGTHKQTHGSQSWPFQEPVFKSVSYNLECVHVSKEARSDFREEWDNSKRPITTIPNCPDSWCHF